MSDASQQPQATDSSTGQPRLTPGLFAAIQGAILLAILGGVYFIYAANTAPLAMAPLNDEPLIIPPLYDRPDVVSDEQLVAALTKLRPQLGANPAVASVDHALRFWGLEATFDDQESWSGEDMRDYLVDNRIFTERPEGEPARDLLTVTEDDGVRYRTLEGSDSSSHVDHTLACLAEVGTPLSFQLNTANGPMPLRAVMEQSMRDFSLNQVEYEWSGLALALYAQSPAQWTTSEGQAMDFDVIADRIMRQRLPQGVCQGNHRLHSLVMFLRIDNEQDILSDETRQRVVEYLKAVTELLVAKQHESGFWGEDWPTAADGAGEPEGAGEDSLDAQSWRVLVTGHVLEWWSLAPEEVLPPDDVLQKAGQWTVQAIADLSEEELSQHYGPLSHAGRALALWRKKWPHEVTLPAVAVAPADANETPDNAESGDDNSNDNSSGETAGPSGQ